jgi:hypothetical protein
VELTAAEWGSHSPQGKRRRLDHGQTHSAILDGAREHSAKAPIDPAVNSAVSVGTVLQLTRKSCFVGAALFDCSPKAADEDIGFRRDESASSQIVCIKSKKCCSLTLSGFYQAGKQFSFGKLETSEELWTHLHPALIVYCKGRTLAVDSDERW